MPTCGSVRRVGGKGTVIRFAVIEARHVLAHGEGSDKALGYP
jgi:hypothetical protein